MAAQLISVFGLMLISPHIWPLLEYIFVGLRRCWDRQRSPTKQVLQGKYEEIHTGSDFLVELRLGQLAALTWAGFWFLPAVPILPACLPAFVMIFYWFDKFMYLRYAAKPRNTDDRTIGYFIELLQYSFLWHGVAGTLVFSN